MEANLFLHRVLNCRVLGAGFGRVTRVVVDVYSINVAPLAVILIREAVIVISSGVVVFGQRSTTLAGGLSQ